MNKKAFTLIELLVVVLIIGILAAVAVPQYQKAVQKARFTQLQIYVDSLKKAHEVYFLANGSYTDNIENLDITVPPFSFDMTLQCHVLDTHDGCTLYNKSDMQPIIQLAYWRFNKKIYCCSYKSTNWSAEDYCLNITGTSQKKTTDEDHCYWENK